MSLATLPIALYSRILRLIVDVPIEPNLCSPYQTRSRAMKKRKEVELVVIWERLKKEVKRL